jgi:hypothetical protein
MNMAIKGRINKFEKILFGLTDIRFDIRTIRVLRKSASRMGYKISSSNS